MVQALGITGISKSEVSRIGAALDVEVSRFRNRALVGAFPYIWVDATYLKVRQNGRVVSLAVVIATGVNAEGHRKVLGLDVGPSEEQAFWAQFLRGLVQRGLTGVQLVTSDAHTGLKRAIAEALVGSDAACISCATPWRSCRRGHNNWLQQRFARCARNPTQ